MIALVALAGCSSYYDYYKGGVTYTQDGTDCIYYSGEYSHNYSDSVSGMAWVRNKMAKTTLTPTPDNGYVRELIKRAEIWLRTHAVRNRVLKWQTEKWGEIPADFGRK